MWTNFQLKGCFSVGTQENGKLVDVTDVSTKGFSGVKATHTIDQLYGTIE